MLLIVMTISDPTEKRRPWLLPAQEKNDIAPGLYLVATPIGNLRDITIRALDTLAAADVIACEDTRVSRKLLAHYGLSGTLWSYNDHNADRQRPAILEKIRAGKAVALVSDAGMPLVSDPGYKLVRACLEAGLPVTSLPGPSAALMGLQLSGLPSDCFSFAGFLPARREARLKALQVWKDAPGPLVLFESAPRLLATLEAVLAVMGDRQVAVLRELTKLFEEGRRGALSALVAHYTLSGPPKGEIVIVVGPGDKAAPDADEIDLLLRAALETMSVRDAASAVAATSGQKRKQIYARALELSGAAE